MQIHSTGNYSVFSRILPSWCRSETLKGLLYGQGSCGQGCQPLAHTPTSHLALSLSLLRGGFRPPPPAPPPPLQHTHTHNPPCTICTQSLDQLRPRSPPQPSVPLLGALNSSSILWRLSPAHGCPAVFPAVLNPCAGITIRQVCRQGEFQKRRVMWALPPNSWISQAQSRLFVIFFFWNGGWEPRRQGAESCLQQTLTHTLSLSFSVFPFISKDFRSLTRKRRHFFHLYPFSKLSVLHLKSNFFQLRS